MELFVHLACVLVVSAALGFLVRRWFDLRWPWRPRPVLLVMHLDDMHRVHPDQIEARCSRCGGPVGVYPSGQQVLREMKGVRVVCNRCTTPGPDARLAPGADVEPWESRDK